MTWAFRRSCLEENTSLSRVEPAPALRRVRAAGAEGGTGGGGVEACEAIAR